MNPYLTRLRSQYDGLRTAVEGIQTRAAGETRDLTEDELRSVTEQVEQARALGAQIEVLADFETRSVAVGQLGATLDAGREAEGEQSRNAGQPGEQGIERLTGNAQTRDRDPGHYRSVKDGGRHSFFHDAFTSQYFGNREAATRLAEHARATLTTGANGPGTVLPHWLENEFQTANYQQRALANQVRNIPLDGDARPLTLPKQTASTTGAVGVQANEGDAPADANSYDTDVDTVSPKPYIGEQVVSRQFLEMSSPALDVLIYSDLNAVVNSKLETAVGTAMVAGAASNVATIVSDLPDSPAAGDSFGENGGALASDAVIDATALIYSTRFAAPTLIAVTPQRFGKFRKLRDGNNRPIMPVSAYSPQNAAGVATGLLAGEFEGLTMLATTGLGDGSTFPEKFLVCLPEDTLLFEDAVMQYRFEEKGGPSKITLGIWKYAAVIVRQGGTSTRTVTVTASAHA